MAVSARMLARGLARAKGKTRMKSLGIQSLSTLTLSKCEYESKLGLMKSTCRNSAFHSVNRISKSCNQHDCARSFGSSLYGTTAAVRSVVAQYRRKARVVLYHGPARACFSTGDKYRRDYCSSAQAQFIFISQYLLRCFLLTPHRAMALRSIEVYFIQSRHPPFRAGSTVQIMIRTVHVIYNPV